MNVAEAANERAKIDKINAEWVRSETKRLDAARVDWLRELKISHDPPMCHINELLMACRRLIRVVGVPVADETEKEKAARIAAVNYACGAIQRTDNWLKK